MIFMIAFLVINAEHACIDFMWCQNLTTRRGVAEGDWPATMSVEERALTILFQGTLLKVPFLFNFINYSFLVFKFQSVLVKFFLFFFPGISCMWLYDYYY